MVEEIARTSPDAKPSIVPANCDGAAMASTVLGAPIPRERDHFVAGDGTHRGERASGGDRDCRSEGVGASQSKGAVADAQRHAGRQIDRINEDVILGDVSLQDYLKATAASTGISLGDSGIELSFG